MPEMTARQAKDWPETVAFLNTLCQDSLPDNIGSWDVEWSDETRPGRGHYLNATYNSGEYFAQITMDVYGNPRHSLAELTWVHASGDEECPCHCNDYEEESEED